MVILISGASHTGKTLLAQKLMERYRYPVLSLDLLKMGLIRSGQTDLTPEDDDQLVPYLWGIVREMVKTAIENGQNLIVEGCYIPFDWREDFEPEYLSEIESCCLVMTRRYLEEHSDDVVRFGNVIEQRLFDDVDIDGLVNDNERALVACREHDLPYCLIDDTYAIGDLEIGSLSDRDLESAARLFFATVHTVNARDYSSEQLGAWAPRDGLRCKKIAEKLAGQLTVGAKESGILVGLGSLDADNDIDMLYVHKDRQRQGIGKAVLDNLEKKAAARGCRSVATFSSITARPFFERMGYIVEYENEVVRDGVALTNYRMVKQLSGCDRDGS